MSRAILLLCIAATGLASSFAHAITYRFSLQLSAPLSSGLLAFDFLDGGAPGNSVTISGFSSDAALGSESIIGDVTGNLSGQVILSDSEFFSEYLQPVSGLSSLLFNFADTANAPDVGAVPDTFSFFLLNDVSGLPLFDTTDPSGAGALLALEIDGSASGNLLIYGPATTPSTAQWSVSVVEQIPEPTTLALTVAALAACAVVYIRRTSL